MISDILLASKSIFDGFDTTNIGYSGVNYADFVGGHEYHQMNQIMENQSSSGSYASTSSPKNVVGRLNVVKVKKCNVCGNPGATSHYGGTVCGGCKIFFSRTVQSKKGFVCEREGRCPMSAGKRAKCRACRFQLCLRAHMSPEEVGRLRDMRLGENSNVVKKEEVSIVGYFDESTYPSSSVSDCINQIASFVDSFTFNSPNSSILNIFINLENSCDNNMNIQSAHYFSTNCNADISLWDAISYPMPICERIPLDYISSQIRYNPEEYFKLFWCRHVLHFLEWTTSFDDLNRIPESEKYYLIASNMFPVQLLVCFYTYLRMQKNDLKNCPDTTPPLCSPLFFGQIQGLSEEVSNALTKAIKAIMEPLNDLDVSIEEMIILKAIILFSGGTSTPSHKEGLIRCYRLKYCDLLRKIVRSRVKNKEEGIYRLTQLLMMVKSVKYISIYLENWMTIFFTSNQYGMRENLIYEFHVKATHHQPASNDEKQVKMENY